DRGLSVVRQSPCGEAAVRAAMRHAAGGVRGGTARGDCAAHAVAVAGSEFLHHKFMIRLIGFLMLQLRIYWLLELRNSLMRCGMNRKAWVAMTVLAILVAGYAVVQYYVLGAERSGLVNLKLEE